MAGEDRAPEVVAYLSRLMGTAPSTEEPLGLRSVHRAALASWARKQGVPVQLSVISSGVPFSIRELLSANGSAPPATASAPPSSTHFSFNGHAGTAGIGSLGIDIEEVENLPEATDYREHSFYQDHFTPAEIAYCLRQVDVRASLCGTWAMKEALLKSGLAGAPSGSLKHIEISRDESGRPSFPGCQLSISHTPRTAVAVCVAVAAAPPTRPVGSDSSTEAKPLQLERERQGKRWPWSRARS